MNRVARLFEHRVIDRFSKTSRPFSMQSAMASSIQTRVRVVAVQVKSNTLHNFNAEPTDAESAGALAEAAQLLQNDQVVAFPTETVYGLGANGLKAEAAAKIFQAKNRPGDNPLIVHVSTLDMLREFAELPSQAQPLIERFWPGPLTLLLHYRAGAVPSNVTCGLNTVAVRMPAHPVARKLIEQSKCPLAAPSANRSGRPSPTTAAHVLHDLDGRIPLIIDGGQADVGVESTVVDLLQDPPVLLRPGGITYEQLLPLLPSLRVYKRDFSSESLELRPTTPGMKYKHYSPDAKVILYEPTTTASDITLSSALAKEIAMLQEAKIPFGVIRTSSSASAVFNGTLLPYSSSMTSSSAGIEYVLSQSSQPDEVAHGLFKALRDLDEINVKVILVEGIDEEKEGLAVMNRLRKAASEIVLVQTEN